MYALDHRLIEPRVYICDSASEGIGISCPSRPIPHSSATFYPRPSEQFHNKQTKGEAPPTQTGQNHDSDSFMLYESWFTGYRGS